LDQTGKPNFYTQSLYSGAKIYNDKVQNVTNKSFSKFLFENARSQSPVVDPGSVILVAMEKGSGGYTLLEGVSEGL